MAFGDDTLDPSNQVQPVIIGVFDVWVDETNGVHFSMLSTEPKYPGWKKLGTVHLNMERHADIGPLGGRNT